MRIAARCAVLAALIAGLPCSAPARAQDAGSLLDLDLEALLDIPVSSAGLSASSLRDVPALADVLTAEQLRAHGVSTLAEAIALFPGIRLQQRQTFLNAYAAVHGMAVNDNDSHLLLLMDGVPWRVATSGGANRLLYDGFPIALVERLEFVRAQAAIVHGSNAISGVVNIVTRDPRRGDSRVSLGLRDGAAVGAVQAAWAAEGAALSVFAGRERGARGWMQDGLAIALRGGGIARVSGNLAQRADAFSLLGRIGETRVQAIHLASDGITPSSLQFGAAYVPPASDRTTALRVQDLRALGDWRLHAAAAIDRTTLDYDTVSGWGERQSLRLAIEAPVRGRVRGFAGLQAAWAAGEVAGVVPEWRTREAGVFAQAYAELADGLELGLGLQYQWVSDGASGTTPQASLRWMPGGGWRFKWLRGESFRDADARERFSDAPFQLGRPDLRPEQGRIDALELGHEGPGWSLLARLYEQRITNLIVLVPAGGRLVFDNRATATVSGSELQIQRRAGPWRLDGAWRHLFSTGDTEAPRDLLKLRATWGGEDSWSIGLALEAAGPASRGSRLLAARPVVNPPAGGYALLDAHVAAPLARWCPALGAGGRLSLSLRNVLDREVWQPTSTSPLNTLPYREGRAWRLMLELPF